MCGIAGTLGVSQSNEEMNEENLTLWMVKLMNNSIR